jgi:hypothetical protein
MICQRLVATPWRRSERQSATRRLELLEEQFERVPGRTVRDLIEHYEHEDRRR